MCVGVSKHPKILNRNTCTAPHYCCCLTFRDRLLSTRHNTPTPAQVPLQLQGDAENGGKSDSDTWSRGEKATAIWATLQFYALKVKIFVRK